jgi:hypothetical protein
LTRENGKAGDELRDLPRVSEGGRRGAGSEDGSRRTEDDWSGSGTEDPAFFIKPSDEN